MPRLVWRLLVLSDQIPYAVRQIRLRSFLVLITLAITNF